MLWYTTVVPLRASLTLLLFLPAVISKVWNVVILHILLNTPKLLCSIFFWKVVTHIVRHLQISCLPPVRVPWRSAEYEMSFFSLKPVQWGANVWHYNETWDFLFKKFEIHRGFKTKKLLKNLKIFKTKKWNVWYLKAHVKHCCINLENNAK